METFGRFNHYSIWGEGEDCKGMDVQNRYENDTPLPTGGKWSMAVYQMEPGLAEKIRSNVFATVTYSHMEWGPVLYHGCYRSDVLRGPVARADAPDDWDVKARLQHVWSYPHQKKKERSWLRCGWH